MKISRRAFVTAVLAAGAATAVGVGANAVAAAAPGGGGTYQPGPPRGTARPSATPSLAPSNRPIPQIPDRVPGGGMGDMIMQRPDGTWISHALPFAAPFPNRAAAVAAIAQARAQGLIR